nr:hypothetical protein [Tanacetum cinerariifolium]
ERAVHCKELSGFKYQHDMVRDVLFDICRYAGTSAKKEGSVNFLTNSSDKKSTLRPAHILGLYVLGIELGFFSQKGGEGRDVKEKRQGSANDTNKVNVVVPFAGDGHVLSSSIGHMVEKVTGSGNNKGTQDENVGQTPINSTGDPNTGTSYAKSFTEEPSSKSVNFHTLITLARNVADVVVPLSLFFCG